MVVENKGISKKWYTAYALAKAYYEKNGHLDISARYVDPVTGTKLGAWIKTQRYARRDNAIKQTITPEQIRLLDEIGMNWKRTDGNKGSWKERVRRIQAYKDKNSHCNVPKTYKDPDGYPLGRAVSNIRSINRGTTKGKIPPDIKKQLDEMGFNWGKSSKQIMSESWKEGYDSLRSFLESGHTQEDITEALVWNGYNLGKWFHALVSSYRGASSYAPLSTNRYRQLKALGVDLAVSRPRITLTVHDFSDRKALKPELNKPVLVYLPNSVPSWREGIRVGNDQYLVGGKIIQKKKISGWAEYPGKL